jgi:hypothetical protein
LACSACIFDRSYDKTYSAICKVSRTRQWKSAICFSYVGLSEKCPHFNGIAAMSTFQQYSGNVRIIQYLASKWNTNTFEINLFSENTELSAEPLTKNLDWVSSHWHFSFLRTKLYMFKSTVDTQGIKYYSRSIYR